MLSLPPPFGDERDWEMFIRDDGSRYIAFTEDGAIATAFAIVENDHFTLRADDGSATVTASSTEQNNAIALIAPHEVTDTFTIDGTVETSGTNDLGITLDNIMINGNLAPSAQNQVTLPAGTAFRVNHFLAILNAGITINNTNALTLTPAQVTLNATPLVGEQGFRTITESHTQTRVELELVEGSTVGGVDLFDYLDALAPASTSGGDGQLRIQTSAGPFYTRSSVWHTPSNQRWVASADTEQFQEEFRVTAIFVGDANTGRAVANITALPPNTGVNALTYTDVSVSWSSRPLSGEFHMVWRGDQDEIDAIITALGSTANRHAMYFNTRPTTADTNAARVVSHTTTPHIRAISNYAAYITGSGPQVQDLILTPGNDGFSTDVGMRSNFDSLPTTPISGLIAGINSTARQAEVPARVQLVGAQSFAFSTVPLALERRDAGSPVVVETVPFDIEFLYYGTANTTEGGSPFARPGQRTPINTVVYRPGTTLNVRSVTVNGQQAYILDFTGPDAQRAADDVTNTFVAGRTGNRGALWFANEGNGFSEVGWGISIPFEAFLANTRFMVASQLNAHAPSFSIPQLLGLSTRHASLYQNTTIAWERQSDHSYLLTVAGADRMRLYRDLLVAFSDGPRPSFTLMVNTQDSPLIPADIQAAPYLTMALPDLASYRDENQKLLGQSVTEPFDAPNSAFTQGGMTQLRLWEIDRNTTERLNFFDGRSATIVFPSGQTSIALGGAGASVTNYASIADWNAARPNVTDNSLIRLFPDGTNDYTARSTGGPTTSTPITVGDLLPGSSSTDSSCYRSSRSVLHQSESSCWYRFRSIRIS